jgi:hypothetical protein
MQGENMKRLKRAWLIATATSLCGCAGPAMRPPTVSTAPLSVNTVAQVPESGQLPANAVRAGTSQYIIEQTEGGSIFLGPIVGAMHIKHKTRQMAEKNSQSVFDIDPVAIASAALASSAIPEGGATASYVVKPYVFIEHCTDGKFRSALVFQVEARGGQPWVGRYTYDLPTPIQDTSFAGLNEAGRAQYRDEMTQGAAALSDLMHRDLEGKLPRQGRKVKVGTLWMVGERIGGMGIYSQPEEISLPAQVLDESGGFVTVRVDGGLGATQWYGVHLIRRDLIHTLKPTS